MRGRSRPLVDVTVAVDARCRHGSDLGRLSPTGAVSTEPPAWHRPGASGGLYADSGFEPAFSAFDPAIPGLIRTGAVPKRKA